MQQRIQQPLAVTSPPSERVVKIDEGWAETRIMPAVQLTFLIFNYNSDVIFFLFLISLGEYNQLLGIREGYILHVIFAD